MRQRLCNAAVSKHETTQRLCNAARTLLGQRRPGDLLREIYCAGCVRPHGYDQQLLKVQLPHLGLRWVRGGESHNHWLLIFAGYSNPLARRALAGSRAARLVCTGILHILLAARRPPTALRVSFYGVKEAGRSLIIGPYQGHVLATALIAFGKGVCGSAAAELATQIVDDVAVCANYIPCDDVTRSEIVVPCFGPNYLNEPEAPAGSAKKVGELHNNTVN